MKTCESCGIEFEPKRSTAKYCSDKCRVTASRVSVTNDTVSNDVTLNQNANVTLKESADEWLARRIKETNSKGFTFIKTGNPPGTTGTIKVPSNWDVSDFDVAAAYR
jgi:hypothetical protein